MQVAGYQDMPTTLLPEKEARNVSQQVWRVAKGKISDFIMDRTLILGGRPGLNVVTIETYLLGFARYGSKLFWIFSIIMKGHAVA
jgi:hypothetical protein